MDEFNYLSVPISIILGLAIAELLTGVGRVIQCRDRVKSYWLSLVWTGILLVTSIQSWWALFGLRRMQDWNFFSFLIVLLHPLALFLLASLVLPGREEFVGHDEVDVKSHYFKQRQWFFAAILLTIVASLVRPLVFKLPLSLNLDVAIQGFLFFVALGAIFVRAAWYQVVATLIFAATIATYIGLLFVHL